MIAYDEVDVLLVEDNQQDAELALRALRKGDFRGKTLWVRDGVEALAFVRRTDAFEERAPQRPKLVLLDLKMPRLDGFAVLRSLKSDAATRSIPIVVLTSSNQPRDIAESYQCGANGFVTKPIQSKELEASVARLADFWLRLNRVT